MFAPFIKTDRDPSTILNSVRANNVRRRTYAVTSLVSDKNDNRPRQYDIVAFSLELSHASLTIAITTFKRTITITTPKRISSVPNYKIKKFR